MTSRSCIFCRGPHNSGVHKCNICKQVGHAAYQHCSKCNVLKFMSDGHFCDRNKLVDIHIHRCEYCLLDHESTQHVCHDCNQVGHGQRNCQSETFCKVCKGKVGHFTSCHYDCKSCNRNVFTKHMPCPKEGCQGCASEKTPPQAWYNYLDGVQCTVCGTTWDNLDHVIAESY